MSFLTSFATRQWQSRLREEQASITKSVALETQSIEKTEERINREVALLHEYRTRLIADVVTGKLDVREAAARLPDEAEEPELLDEADVLDETTSADAEIAEESV